MVLQVPVGNVPYVKLSVEHYRYVIRMLRVRSTPIDSEVEFEHSDAVRIKAVSIFVQQTWRYASQGLEQRITIRSGTTVFWKSADRKACIRLAHFGSQESTPSHSTYSSTLCQQRRLLRASEVAGSTYTCTGK